MTGKYRPSCRKRPWVTLWLRCGSAATWTLYRLANAAAVGYLNDQAQTGLGEARGHALDGLAELADVEPPAWKLLKGGPRLPVVCRVARRRLSRHRGQIARRLVGATIGAGLGLAFGSFLRVLLSEDAMMAMLVAQFSLLTGAVAGLVTGVGLAVPSALANKDRWAMRALFGGLAGALGYALAISLESSYYQFQQPVPGAYSLLAGIIAGLLIGIGVGLSPAAGKRSTLQIVGGGLGGAVGFLIARSLGLLTELSPMMAVLTGALAGALLGLGLVVADRIRFVVDRSGKEEQL